MILFDADTDQALLTLQEGATISLENLSERRLSIQALTNLSSVASVKFELDAVMDLNTSTQKNERVLAV